MLSFFLDDGLKLFLTDLRLCQITRKKNDSGAVMTGLGKGKPQRLTGSKQKPMRHLQQNTGAITGVFFAATGAAVLQIPKYGQGLLDRGI